MTTATTTREVQIQIALEVLTMDESGKTKAQIAKEYEVSPRSVTRYAEKYEDEAMDLLAGTNEPEETTELKAAFEPKVEVQEPETKEEETVTEAEETQEEVKATETKEKPKRKKREVVRDENGLTPNQNWCLETYYKLKASGEMTKTQDRQGKTGRAKKGVKTLRYITMEILEAHAEAGTLLKENKDDIIKEIMEAGGCDEKSAKQYFSGHKILFGGFQN